MMEFLQIINTRRSIRKYSSERIDENTIIDILKAAQFAPSAVNKQPWHFIVVDDKALFQRIMQIHPHAKMLSTASHAILVCGDENLQHDDGYWIADCGAATENILLAAHSLGVGSCWIGLYPREQRMKDISSLFGLPSHVKPFALVSLGYPDEKKIQPERFDPGKVFRNEWNNIF